MKTKKLQPDFQKRLSAKRQQTLRHIICKKGVIPVLVLFQHSCPQFSAFPAQLNRVPSGKFNRAVPKELIHPPGIHANHPGSK